MGQAVSYNQACRLLQDEVGIEEPFVVTEPHEGENSSQRVVCLVSIYERGDQFLGLKVEFRFVSVLC